MVWYESRKNVEMVYGETKAHNIMGPKYYKKPCSCNQRSFWKRFNDKGSTTIRLRRSKAASIQWQKKNPGPEYIFQELQLV